MPANLTRRAALVLASIIMAPFVHASQGEGETTILGIDWRAAEIDGKAIAQDVEVDLRIEADGTAAGRGGCNRFGTTASIEGDTITFAPVAATRITCAPDTMAFEARFFAALEATRRFSFDADAGELYLHDADGSTLLRLVRS